MAGIVKKTQIVPFVNVAESPEMADYKRIKKSTTFGLSMNPESETFDFISSDTPEEELKTYKPTLSQSLTMFKDEPDYEFFFKKFYNRATGGEAHADVLIVFYQEKGTNTSPEPTDVYKCWKVDATIKFNDMDSVGSVINFDLALSKFENGAVGALPDGKVDFIAGTWADDKFTPAV